jgi:hypothetical protein
VRTYELGRTGVVLIHPYSAVAAIACGKKRNRALIEKEGIEP